MSTKIQNGEKVKCASCGHTGDSAASDYCVGGWNASSGPWYAICDSCVTVFKLDWEDASNCEVVTMTEVDIYLDEACDENGAEYF